MDGVLLIINVIQVFYILSSNSSLGDELGTFNSSVTCEPATTVLNDTSETWIFSPEAQNNNDPVTAASRRSENTMWAFIGIGIGMLLSAIGVVVIATVVLMVKKRKGIRKFVVNGQLNPAVYGKK